jgi:putative ABC transport system permease protein
MRWRDARNGTPGMQQFVDRLGAVPRAGRAPGWRWAASAFRRRCGPISTRKTHHDATLKTLGAEAADDLRRLFRSRSGC